MSGIVFRGHPQGLDDLLGVIQVQAQGARVLLPDRRGG